MQTNVSQLLREFPKVKRAALAGERVIIRTREGNLVLTAEKSGGGALSGCMKGRIHDRGLKPETSGADASEWKPGL